MTSDFYAFDLGLAATALEERAARLRSDAKRTSAAGAAVLEQEACLTDIAAATFRRAHKAKRGAENASAAAKSAASILGDPYPA